MTEQPIDREQHIEDRDVFAKFESHHLRSYRCVLSLNQEFQDYLNRFAGQDAQLISIQESFNADMTDTHPVLGRRSTREKHLTGRVSYVDEAGVVFNIESAFIKQPDGTRIPHPTGTLRYPYSEAEFRLASQIEIPYHEYVASIMIRGEDILAPIYSQFDINKHFLNIIKKYEEAMQVGYVQEAVTKKALVGSRFIQNETILGEYFWLLQENYLNFLKQYKGKSAEIGVYEMDTVFDDINGDINRGRGSYTLRGKIQEITERFVVLSGESGYHEIPFCEGRRQVDWEKSKHISSINVEDVIIL